MTQDFSDPWAAAQASLNGGGESASQGESQVVPDEEQESQLFGGGSVAPSLANKTHRIGSERTGIITRAPYDRQKVDYNTKKPLFWPKAESSEKGPIPLDKGGDPKRPVMDTFFEVMTDYVMDASEATETGRSEPHEGGERVFVAGGHTLKTTRKAMETYNTTALPSQKIAKGADLIGKRLTYRRVGQKPNPGGTPSWVEEITITKA